MFGGCDFLGVRCVATSAVFLNLRPSVGLDLLSAGGP